MKKLRKIVVSAALALSLCISGAFGAGLESFQKVVSYTSGQFTDVASTSWYAGNVQTAYELGLINGTSSTTFSPDKNLTIAEAIKLACVLHATYNDSAEDFSASSPWYQSYVDYAKANGIISANYTDYTAAATRAQFAQILGAALPAEALTQINDIEDGAIPDVQQSSNYGSAVYLLYRAGVLTGSNSKGTFYPNNTIRRSESAAIVTRMADPSLRMSVTIVKQVALSASEVFDLCSPAVFYIVVYDQNGTATATGSGVFISADGDALTNYHVIDGAYSAKISTSTGAVYDVAGCYDYDETFDLAYIKISGSGFSYLEMSETVTTGEAAYAIGSPLGLQNSLTEGIVSSASQPYSGVNYIQTTAAISHGSSGGALLNSYGELIGITTAYIEGGQNIYLSVPITYFSSLTKGGVQTLTQIAEAKELAYSSVATYDGYYPAPDFGAYVGAPVYKTENSKNGTTLYYYYAASQFTMNVSDAIDGYFDLLQKNGFQYYRGDEGEDYTILYYYNGNYRIYLGYGGIDTDSESYVVIALDKA